MYRIGASVHHREQHLRWNNLILPKGDPTWNHIFPPNGYGCQCYTVAITEARKQRYEQNGVPYYDRRRFSLKEIFNTEYYHTHYDEYDYSKYE